MKDAKGKLYFGGINGFNAFFPDSIYDNLFIPKVVFTDFLISNKPVEINASNSPLKKHISLTEKIILGHSVSVITLKYAALNYILPKKNQYAYKLEGFEEDWNYVGNKREATFTSLEPGTYTFRVKASNNDGYWNETGTSIQIIILPPWWQKWWFRFLVGFSVAGILVGFYFWRVNQLKRQREELQRKVIQRTNEIEKKNVILKKQTVELSEINVLLEERQEQVEEQTEELKAQAEDLLDANISLTTLNATKDKFFSIIAHDLKNPFNSILGFCEVLFNRYEVYDDNKRKHLIGIIFQSAQNIFKLLENLLQWARSQTGSIKFIPEEFEIEEMISNNLILMENQMNEKQISSEKDIPPGVKVFADKNMINTVIRNMISNAIKFSEGGEITIRLKEDNRTTTIFISDTGLGMRPEEAKSLFEIGTTKSSEGTRGEPGTGLGLIICKDFIEKHGGKIGVDSELGKGSTFYFSLPKN